VAPDRESESFPETVAVTKVVPVRQKGVGGRTGLEGVEAIGGDAGVDDNGGIGGRKVIRVNRLADPFVEGRPVVNAGKDFLHLRLLSGILAPENGFR
jgi:hypothetical protein